MRVRENEMHYCLLDRNGLHFCLCEDSAVEECMMCGLLELDVRCSISVVDLSFSVISESKKKKTRAECKMKHAENILFFLTELIKHKKLV